jgi:hypothetical protein
MSTIRTVKLDLIDLDGSPLLRQLDGPTVERYAEAMEEDGNADRFPPVTLFEDGDGTFWLADGRHRVTAALRAELEMIRANVRPGTRRDAQLFAAGCNAEHGLPRRNEDKEAAVLLLLNDPEWGKWSDREIARHCRVSHPFVGKVRGQAASGNVTRCADATVRTAQRGGATYAIDTSNIGRGKPEPSVVPDDDPLGFLSPLVAAGLLTDAHIAELRKLKDYYPPGLVGRVTNRLFFREQDEHGDLDVWARLVCLRPEEKTLFNPFRHDKDGELVAPPVPPAVAEADRMFRGAVAGGAIEEWRMGAYWWGCTAAHDEIDPDDLGFFIAAWRTFFGHTLYMFTLIERVLAAAGRRPPRMPTEGQRVRHELMADLSRCGCVEWARSLLAKEDPLSESWLWGWRLLREVGQAVPDGPNDMRYIPPSLSRWDAVETLASTEEDALTT